MRTERVGCYNCATVAMAEIDTFYPILSIKGAGYDVKLKDVAKVVSIKPFMGLPQKRFGWADSKSAAEPDVAAAVREKGNDKLLAHMPCAPYLIHNNEV